MLSYHHQSRVHCKHRKLRGLHNIQGHDTKPKQAAFANPCMLPATNRFLYLASAHTNALISIARSSTVMDARNTQASPRAARRMKQVHTNVL